MPGKDAERIMEIRAKARDERALVADLERRMTDCEFKRVVLQPAIWSLDDVDRFFLAKENLDEPRTPQALSTWLDRAQAALDAAISHRKHAEATVKKFGPDATLTRLAQREG